MASLEEFRRANLRRASVAKPVEAGGDDPLASNLGLVPVARQDEEWPLYEGEPLLFVCQLNLTEAPAVPDLLKDVALLTFFMAEDPGEFGEENGQGWLLRTYPTLHGLVPLPEEDGETAAETGAAVQWQAVDDFPCEDDPELALGEGEELPEGEEFENVHQTKVGGWASSLQSEPWWGYREHPAEPRYCLQIDTVPELGLEFGDGGTVYLARGTASGHEDEWFLDWQSY